MPINSFENYPMNWKPDFNRMTGPKYMAIVKMLEEDIKLGVLKPGMKLPPQRELADYLDINLSTISRAFKICEQRGLISASIGNGTYISTDVTVESMLLSDPHNETMIEMGAIIPSLSYNELLQKYMTTWLRQHDPLQYLTYGKLDCNDKQRHYGKYWFSKSGFEANPNQILFSAGGQNAIAACFGALFEPGDRIGTDSVTYPGIKNVAKLFHLQLIPIQGKHGELTEEGIRYAIQNEHIKGLYVIPDYHNPTAHIMSEETRKMIARLANELEFYVIEDSINSLLMDMPMKPIASYAKEQVILLSSLSKTISPALRTAFLHVPAKIKAEIMHTLYAMNITISPLLANLSISLIEDGIAEQILNLRKENLRHRNHCIDSILGCNTPANYATCPLRWLKLPDYFTGKSFELCAKEANVQVYGAERFAIGNTTVDKAIRIAVTTPPSLEQLEMGIKRIYALMNTHEEDVFLD